MDDDSSEHSGPALVAAFFCRDTHRPAGQPFDALGITFGIAVGPPVRRGESHPAKLVLIFDREDALGDVPIMLTVDDPEGRRMGPQKVFDAEFRADDRTKMWSIATSVAIWLPGLWRYTIWAGTVPLTTIPFRVFHQGPGPVRFVA
jgi:hypothetical protein